MREPILTDASTDPITDPTRDAIPVSVSDSPPLADAGRNLLGWLVDRALPLWSSTGVDAESGGFFEKIDLQGWPVEEPRRARVVARQIYVFATAARRGWLPSADALVEHGLRFLFDRMRLPDGTFAAAVQPDGRVVRGGFDLYEHAFVLFALAAARRGRPDRAHLESEAGALLGRMRSRWAHPLVGFEEAAPRRLPLQSNPHMHLLEAALEWVDVLPAGPARAAWQALADELVGLCLSRFIDTQSGALHEYFDGDWRRMAGRAGGVVEPGHQFEWAWLLMRTAAAGGGSERARDVARRLLHIGEECGVDRARGVAVNELDATLNITDGDAKLWPQTERVKAWHAAAAERPGDPAAAANPRRALADALGGLSRYLLAAPAGLWHEQMRPDGGFVPQDCRASSLYHIVCAIDTVSGGLPSTVGATPSRSPGGRSSG